MKYEYKGLRRILEAFKNSFDGLKYIFKSEEAFRQDVVLAAILVPLIFVFDFSNVEIILLCFSLIFIFIAELCNTAIEVVVDRVSFDWHKLSKAAKDIGSLIVLLSFVNLIITWAMILGSRIF